MWLLFTEYTAEEVYRKLEKISEKCFEIYHITDFNPSNMHGRLLSKTWAWLCEIVEKNRKIEPEYIYIGDEPDGNRTDKD